MATTEHELAISVTVNGIEHRVVIEPRTLLLDLLRDTLGLTGAKRSCDEQVCGACTVLVAGMAVSACTYLAYEADGAHVLTVEGLADGDDLHPVQQAFIDAGGFQCGFCTPGMILTAVALLHELPRPQAAAIGDYLQGNICRCTGYYSIVRAVALAADRLEHR